MIVQFLRCSVVIALLSILSFTAAHALDNQADKTIKEFLSSKTSDRESAEPQGSAVTDLNNDGNQEIILVWTLLGPTYWHNTLTIFSKTAKGYKPVSSLELIGEAKLSSVKDGIIYVDHVVYAKGDPRCCPSLKKQIQYRWLGKKIIEITAGE